MRPVVVTAVLLLVVLMFTSDSAAWDPSEMCRTKYPAKPCKNTNRGDWLQMGDNYCVKAFFNTEHLGFFAADRACKEYPNGHLVSIHNDDELSIVQCAMYKATTGKAHYWIGAFLTIRGSGLEWAWADNTKFDYSRWAGGQPDNYQYSEGCVEMNYSDWALWNDLNCKDKRPYVCAVKV
ncbi:C-type lectin PAL [Etheostoma spectabile]|uniref:C-type lectin PAL n=1 Tax=Etheostoma spectabile TaxID=54343 RepID=UPI0013AF893F|nr:C-type lectin PAL-like [Etheostoma spectabile]